MPIDSWSIPMTLATVYGDLDLNEPASAGQQFLVNQEGSDHWNELRSTSQDIPQFDGSLQFERFTGGSLIRLKIELWFNGSPACDSDLREMVDLLQQHLYSLIKQPMSGRLFWTPDGAAVRLQDFIRMASRVQWAWPAGQATSCTVLLDSPFPYAIDFTQTLTNIVASDVLDNTGNTQMFPVFKVYGPAATFVLSNDTTDLQIVFDDSLPGAAAIPGSGAYLEIDTFRSTAYMTTDGGLTFSNYKPGIDVELSDFWGLYPGNNAVSLTTAPSVDVLWQAAWV